MLKRSQSFAGSSSKGRNVVICCDGTGVDEDKRTNQTKTPSNVKKIFNCISTSLPPSLKNGDDGDDPNASVHGDNDNAEEKEEETLPLLQTSEDSTTNQSNGDSKSSSIKDEGQGESAQSARAQIAYYERGVASIGGAIAKAGSGMTGFGMEKKIIMMYSWLGKHWKEYEDEGEEDRLFLFGFSRGAFAVRSLMGMLYHVGLLDLRGLSAKEAQRRAYYAYWRGYAKKQDRTKWAYDGKGKWPWKFFKGDEGRIPIEFIGVWDTVGQLGLPRETFCLWCCGVFCLFTPNKYKYHEVAVHPLVRCGRHAVAMDEMRSTFQPVFDRSRAKENEAKGWTEGYTGEQPDFKQVWFPGSHGNVGGGLVDTGLSDGALKWMIDEAAVKGLRFDEKLVAQIRPNPQGDIYTSHNVSIYKSLTHYPRSHPPVIPENAEETSTSIESIHSSAFARSNDPPINDAPYFPHIRMTTAGDTHRVMIRADKIYNPTYVYLWPGVEYKITAEGTWAGYGNYMVGPEGFEDNIFMRPLSLNFAVGLGRCQRGLREVSGNREAQMPFVRRHEYYPWYSVIGMIACGGVRDATARAEFHEIIGIGKEKVFTVGEKGGYLFCYTNDSWGSYVKNKGNMELTIERLT